jgi:hypothetical protein
MDKPVLQVLDGELLAAGADVPLLIPICLVYAPYAGHQHVAPDIKLAPVIEERHEVSLNNVGVLSAIGHSAAVLDHFPNLIEGFKYLDSVALV